MTCFWQEPVGATQICPGPGAGSGYGEEPIVLFSGFGGSTGVKLPLSELDNALVLPASAQPAGSVQVTGYFTPISGESWDPRDETSPVDLSGYTYVEISPPHELTFDGGESTWVNGDTIPGAPTAWLYATVQVLGTEHIGNIHNSGGF